MVIGDQKLGDGEGDPGGQRGGPDAAHAAPAGESPDHPERHEQGEERQLAANHGGEFVEHGIVAAEDSIQGDDRSAEPAEGHGGRVGDEGEAGGLQRLKAELDEDGGRDGHGRAEAGGAFEERAEGKRDEDDLDPRVGRERRKMPAEHGEQSAIDGQLVEENEIQDNPANGKQSIGRAVGRGAGRGGERHVEGEEGDRQRDAQAEEGRVMNPDLEPGDGA
jgi:hypothetical protein